MLWMALWLGCGPLAREDYTARVINPDEGCVRDEIVQGPPGGGCNDMTVTTMSEDGTCWHFSCQWEDMPHRQGTGGSGPPDDPQWCADSEWFHAQPACDDSDS